jgi:Tol biopolymer transport system component/DNA-binding winged helix-turn-helix (wHTH) protein
MVSRYEFAEFVFDPAEGRLMRGDEPIRLTPRLISLLKVLVDQPGRLVEKQEILDKVWSGTYVSEANITVQVSRLRRLLGETPERPILETIPTRGYRWLLPVRVLAVDLDETREIDLDSYPPDDTLPVSAVPKPDFSPQPPVPTPLTPSDVQSGTVPDPLDAAKGRKGWWERWWRVAVTALAIALVGLVLWVVLPRGSNASSSGLAASPRLTNTLAADTEPAWAPDGQSVAYISNRAGQPTLFVMSLASDAEPRRMTQTIAESPAWSPDGRRLAFVCIQASLRDICIVDADGRHERKVVTAPEDDIDPAWSPDGKRLAFARVRGRGWEVYTVDAAGGVPTRVTLEGWSALDPHWSPDGRRLAVSQWRGSEDFDITVMNVDGSEPTALTSGPDVDLDPVWSPDGSRIAFSRRSGLYVVDVQGGPPMPVRDSQPGDRHPSWSPDGRRVVYQSVRDGNAEIYRTEIGRASGPERLTDSIATDQDPAWAPDDRRLAFASNRDGKHEIYVMNADGSGVERLTTNDLVDLKPMWSPDGRTIAFMRQERGTTDIWTLDLETRTERCLTTAAGDDAEPSWSPDGRRIAFNSFRDGNFEIYVMNADGTGPVNFTTNPARDTYPAWAPDGRSIVFASNRSTTHFYDNDLYAVDVADRSVRRLTTGPPWDAFPAISPDGRWCAFTRSVSTRHDIVMLDLVTGAEIAVANTMADEDTPSWSPDGRRLAYFSNRHGNADIFVQTIAR